MRRYITFILLIFTIFSSVIADENNISKEKKECSLEFKDNKEMEQYNREVLMDIIRGFSSKDIQVIKNAVHKHFVEDGYIQHSPFIADGRDAVISAYETQLNGRHIDFVRHIGIEKNMGMMFCRYALPGDVYQAGVEVFRFECGKAVEHWSVIQKIDPLYPYASKHPFF